MTIEQSEKKPGYSDIMITKEVGCLAVIGTIKEGFAADGVDFTPNFSYADVPEGIAMRITEVLAGIANGLVGLAANDIARCVSPPGDPIAMNIWLLRQLDRYMQALIDALNKDVRDEIWVQVWSVLDTGEERSWLKYGSLLRGTYIDTFGYSPDLPEVLVDKVLGAYLRSAGCDEDQFHLLAVDIQRNHRLNTKIRHARLARSDERFRAFGFGSIAIRQTDFPTEEHVVLASVPVQEAAQQSVRHVPREIFRGLEDSWRSVCLQIWQTVTGLRVVMVGIKDPDNSCKDRCCSYGRTGIVVLNGRHYSIVRDFFWVIDADPSMFLDPASLSASIERIRAEITIATKLLALLP